MYSSILRIVSTNRGNHRCQHNTTLLLVALLLEIVFRASLLWVDFSSIVGYNLLMITRRRFGGSTTTPNSRYYPLGTPPRGNCNWGVPSKSAYPRVGGRRLDHSAMLKWWNQCAKSHLYRTYTPLQMHHHRRYCWCMILPSSSSSIMLLLLLGSDDCWSREAIRCSNNNSSGKWCLPLFNPPPAAVAGDTERKHYLATCSPDFYALTKPFE